MFLLSYIIFLLFFRSSRTFIIKGSIFIFLKLSNIYISFSSFVKSKFSKMAKVFLLKYVAFFLDFDFGLLLFLALLLSIFIILLLLYSSLLFIEFSFDFKFFWFIVLSFT